MEEELNYVAVTFRTNGNSTPENSLETIYDELKTEEQTWDTNLVKPENKRKAPPCTLLHVVAAGLGIICLILVSVIIALSVHFNTVLSEQHRGNSNLTAQNLQLQTEKMGLEKQAEQLTREKDGLNWTLGVILQYDHFPVDSHCPQRVCKPCLDDWVLFQSSCYLFFGSDRYYDWRTWDGSHNRCREMNADLVVIESQEEQEFISNHTKYYDDENHGYWIGLSKKDMMNTWSWVDGRNVTVMFWRTQEPGYRVSCALSLPCAHPLANWHKASCTMRNRWVCETRALIKD